MGTLGDERRRLHDDGERGTSVLEDGIAYTLYLIENIMRVERDRFRGTQ